MRTEHYVYSIGQLAKVTPTTKAEVETHTIGVREHDHFIHTLLLVVDEKFHYPFAVRTCIQMAAPGRASDTIYLSYIWFPSLPDLLDFLARYLSFSQVTQRLPSDDESA